ncbi:MAG TPA: UvrD-helicase domain-containing protein [Candidatus Binatia bacterium]|jgi:ATP-dependent exoDNAse (exonuclease V) beta subunit
MSTAQLEQVPDDAATRERCLDPTRSFIVQAPAGSGKTGLLVLRFLALLARVDEPEAVLAITFSRKAAAEMRHRIETALLDAQISDAPPPTSEHDRRRRELALAVLERDREKQWNLAKSPSRLQVFTIDSFCARIVASTPLVSRLGSTPAVVEDASALYREAARRALSDTGDDAATSPLRVLLERYEMGLDVLEKELVDMLARRDQWLAGAFGHRRSRDEWTTQIEQGFRDVMQAEISAVAAGLEPQLIARIHRLACRSRDVTGNDGNWPTLGSGDLLGDTVESAWAWRQAATLLTKGKPVKLRSRKTRDPEVHAGDATVKQMLVDLAEELEDSPHDWLGRLQRASRLPRSPVFSDDGREGLGALLAVLLHANAALWTIFRERKEVDFTQIALAALDALEPGETLERLDATIEHILVDEFQDTNVLQYEMLRWLVFGWQRSGRRTVFLVGDPMQSIYRFRKAEVGLFLAARSSRDFLEGCDLESESLSVNFRSTCSLISWVNDAFATLMGSEDDPQRSLVRFADAAPGPAAQQGSPVEFILWSDPAGAGGGEVEAAGLADWISRELAARPADGAAGSNGTKPAAPRTPPPVAVLVRARSHALPLLRALETRAPHLSVRATGLDQLADRQTVLDLEALTRALLHPGDRVSWLALLRSPWVGLSLGDLASLVEPDVVQKGSDRATPIALLLGDASALERISADARIRIDRLKSVMALGAIELRARRLDIVVRSAWLRLGGPASGYANASLAALDAEAFFDVLAARAQRGGIDLDELAEMLRKADAPADRDAKVDVEILTIHKAKGLEFDIVVLPGLGRVPRLSGQAGALAMETQASSGRLSLVAPRAARGREDIDEDKYSFVSDREAGRGSAETLRLLYVAATRAKKRLLLSAGHGSLKKDGSPRAHSLLAALDPACPVATATIVDAAAGPPLAVALPLRLVAAPVARAPKSVATRVVVSEIPSTLASEEPEFFAEGKLPEHIGKVYHWFVEKIATDGVAKWDAQRIRDERRQVEYALRSEGALPGEVADATARVIAALVATVDDEKGRWILAAHDDARSEWGLTRWQDGTLTSARFDRTFLADGKRWIVDYKTGPLRGGAANSEAQVEVHRARHAAQLASYRELLLALPGEEAHPVHLGLFFAEWPAGRRWQDITDLVGTIVAEKNRAAEVSA